VLAQRGGASRGFHHPSRPLVDLPLPSYPHPPGARRHLSTLRLTLLLLHATEPPGALLGLALPSLLRWADAAAPRRPDPDAHVPRTPHGVCVGRSWFPPQDQSWGAGEGADLSNYQQPQDLHSRSEEGLSTSSPFLSAAFFLDCRPLGPISGVVTVPPGGDYGRDTYSFTCPPSLLIGICLPGEGFQNKRARPNC